MGVGVGVEVCISLSLSQTHTEVHTVHTRILLSISVALQRHKRARHVQMSGVLFLWQELLESKKMRDTDVL